MVTDPKRLDWTLFDHYAAHVQHLVWEEPRNVSLFALTAIDVSRHGKKPLLPGLRILDWLEPRATHSPFVRLFLTPTIRQLGLMASDVEPSVMTALFEHVGTVCSDIESLIILKDAQGDNTREFTGVVGHALVRFLRGLPDIKSFISEVRIPADCVAALAALPRLLEVGFYVRQKEMEILAGRASTARSSCGAPWFDALEVLALGTDQMDESLQTFLGAMPAGKLRRAVLEFRQQPDTDTVKQHLALVARAASRDALTSLQLDFDRTHALDASSPVLDVGDALRPLYAFPHLATLVIRIPALVVRARALQDIAHAWPELSILSLMSDHAHPPRRDAPCLALADLVPLARNCPQLDMLTLHVNADDSQLPDAAALARLLPEPSRSPLRVFTACDAGIGDPRKTAAVLVRLFPGLREVEYGSTTRYVGNAHVAFKRKWMAVQALLARRSDVSEQSARAVPARW